MTTTMRGRFGLEPLDCGDRQAGVYDFQSCQWSKLDQALCTLNTPYGKLDAARLVQLAAHATSATLLSPCAKTCPETAKLPGHLLGVCFALASKRLRPQKGQTPNLPIPTLGLALESRTLEALTA